MENFELKPAAGYKKNRQRIGRGPGSGQGCTAGRGMNGQKSRSGFKKHPWFEGGQMPLQRRVPKRGFYNRFRVLYAEVSIDKLNKFADGDKVNSETLFEKKIIKKKKLPVKIIGNEELTVKNLEISVAKLTKSAKKIVEDNGCTVKL